MARVSGNVDANGGKISDTSNKNSFTVASGERAGSYRITFNTPFSELPSVIVNVTNWDVESSASTINVGVIPNNNYVDIEFWRNNNYSNHSFAFIAFGSL